MGFIVSSIVEVSMNKIFNIVNSVHVDDWTVEWAIIASNVYGGDFYIAVPMCESLCYCNCRHYLSL